VFSRNERKQPENSPKQAVSFGELLPTRGKLTEGKRQRQQKKTIQIEICDIYQDKGVCWCDADNLDARSILNVLKGAVIVDAPLRYIFFHILGKHGRHAKQ